MKVNEALVGDLITAYSPGYHIITKIEGSTLYYQQVIRSNGKLRASKAKEQCCDAYWCSKVGEDYISREIQRTRDLCDNIRKFI
jgi:hypothetical protein